MHPEIQESYLSVLIAVIASFAFSWIWHGPVFGKLWMRLMKLPNTKPSSSMMMKSMAIGLIGTLLTAHVMVYTTNIWRGSVWGTGMDGHWCMYGFYSGFFAWLGFFVPMLLNTVAWEGRSWKLFGLNAAYWFLNLQIIGMVVSFFFENRDMLPF